MSARTEPCGEFVILTATLSLSYALCKLFQYRVLHVFKVFHFLFKGTVTTITKTVARMNTMTMKVKSWATKTTLRIMNAGDDIE